jgi:signal transduction histidine kinase
MIVIVFILLIIICILSFILYKSHKKYLAEKDLLNKIMADAGEMNNTITSVRYGNLSARVPENLTETTANFASNINRMIETLNDREQMIVEYQTELTRQNTFLTALLNSLSDGIIVLDENFIILRANLKIKQWLKIDELKGESVFKYLKFPDDKDMNELKSDEVFLKNMKDSYFKVSARNIKLKEHDDKYMLVITNCTNQHELDVLKEDFVATLTHDLKVPIIAEGHMLSFLLTGKFGELTDKQIEALENMKSSNEELLELVKVVLDTYRYKDDNLDLHKEAISVKTFFDEIADSMQSIAHKTNNEVVVMVDRDFDIYVDYFQFKRVLKNLVGNAILYGKSNTNVEMIADKTKDEIILSVKDYGHGIPEQHQKRVFNKYYSASKKFRKIGSGLGLYLSKQIVEAHGGKIEIESIVEEYTQFVIKLPKTIK